MFVSNQMLVKFRLRVIDLELVYGIVVDEGWEYSEFVSECIFDRGYGQDNVEILFDFINEVVVYRQWGGIYFFFLKDLIYSLF